MQKTYLRSWSDFLFSSLYTGKAFKNLQPLQFSVPGASLPRGPQGPAITRTCWQPATKTHTQKKKNNAGNRLHAGAQDDVAITDVSLYRGPSGPLRDTDTANNDVPITQTSTRNDSCLPGTFLFTEEASRVTLCSAAHPAIWDEHAKGDEGGRRG